MRFTLVLLLGCAPHVLHDQAVAKTGRHVEWQDKITAATFCTTCGESAPVTVTFGSHLEVVIPTCYAHARSKLGDHDRIAIKIEGSDAKDGELDIADCTSKHVTATLWAMSSDGMRVDAAFDTDLVEPGK